MERKNRRLSLMVNYYPSYIMELSPGVFRYAIPKNLNSHAYKYSASGLTTDPEEWDDGTYSGIRYSNVYGSFEECFNALKDKYGNFGSYDGLELSEGVVYPKLPDIAKDLIECHKKEDPGYEYPYMSVSQLEALRLRQYLKFKDKDVSYVITSNVGHLEIEYNLDPNKHTKENLYSKYPNLYFYDTRFCDKESTYSLKSEEAGPDVKYFLVNEETGTQRLLTHLEFIRLDGKYHRHYYRGNSKLYSLAKWYYYMNRDLILANMDEPFEIVDEAVRQYTRVLSNTDGIDVLYYESGVLKSKEYFQSKGYKVYNK